MLKRLGFILTILLTAMLQIKAAEVKTIYTWSYDDKLISMVYYFDQSDYKFYKDQPRVYNNWAHYLEEESGHDIINAFASEFKKLAAEHKWSDWQLTECAIAFVQTLKYKNDGEWEYPRYPIETLVEKGGDCEDLAILLEAMLLEFGFDCVLVSPDKHMGVGVATKYPIDGAAFTHRGKDYYYIETTSAGWGIGDYPDHLSAGAIIIDPGFVDQGIAISEYSYSYYDYVDDDDVTIAQSDNDLQEEAPASNAPLYNPNAPKRPANTYTIDVDKVVIDGKKETVVTKVVDDGQNTSVVADSE